MNNLFSYLLLILILISCGPKPCRQLERVEPLVSNFDLINLDTVIENLPLKLSESSGIIKLGATLWTHNDNGDKPTLYSFHPQSGNILREVYIKGANNKDWEDLTNDSLYVYIGNFGNNLGDRRNLVIYKIKIQELLTKDSIDLEEIKFIYPDQNEFCSRINHNYDCESIVSLGDSLYIFTKNWQNKQTTLYSLSKTPGIYNANFISSFDSKGLITGATFSNDFKQLFLLGYNYSEDFRPFIWIIKKWVGVNFFDGEMTRKNISNNAQAEGLCMKNDSILLISAEKFSNNEALV